MVPVALTIAGSDPSGGAGIQADLKTFHQFGVYGASAITLLTVQNTRAVTRVEVVAPELLSAQIEAVVSDLAVGAAKTGALGSIGVIEAVSAAARQFRFPLVVDPVMISKHRAELLARDAQQVLQTMLFPLAALVTPNIPEAAALTGRRIETHSDIEVAAGELLKRGCRAVLLKGGHLQNSDSDDYLLTAKGECWLRGQRVQTAHTHGTGCTYSAAITAGLAAGRDLLSAVREAKRFVQRAIETAPGLGAGYGPLNHWAK
jgi:hydroxymethylpyrimidine/phosphomethylpyrimidine kinase